MSAPGRLFVIRCGSLWLGRGGRHLSLCLVERPDDASVFVHERRAREESGRAEQVLGVLCTVESRPVAELLEKKERP